MGEGGREACSKALSALATAQSIALLTTTTEPTASGQPAPSPPPYDGPQTEMAVLREIVEPSRAVTLPDVATPPPYARRDVLVASERAVLL